MISAACTSTRVRHLWQAALPAAIAALAASAAPCRGESAFDPSLPAMGRVWYRMTQGPVRVTLNIAWLGHGRKYRVEQNYTANVRGRHVSGETWSFTDGANTYTHRSAKAGKELERTAASASLQSCLCGTPAKLKDMRLVGTTTILGKRCEIREVKGQKLWIWSGLPLRMEGRGCGGAVTLAATRLDVTHPPAPSLFRVPAGYKVVNGRRPTCAPARPKGSGAPPGDVQRAPSAR